MPVTSALLDQVSTQALAYLETRHEGTVLVGFTAGGERSVQCLRSPSASVAPVPTTDGIFEIGSISKLFTTTILAALEHEGVLSLDDPISRHLPDLKLVPPIAALTLRQLATHSSGLPSTGEIHLRFIAEETRGIYPPFGAYTHYLRYREEHLRHDLETAELVYPPGEGWLYSILGMGTVGYIIQRATGRSYEDLVRTTISEPLGLTSTGYTLSDEQRARLTYAYDIEGQPLPSWFHDVLLPQGGLRSSMDDLLSFAEANLRSAAGDSAPLMAAMRCTREQHLVISSGPHTPDPLAPPWSTDVRHGLGWRHIEHPHGLASWHPGTTLFYHSAIGVDEAAGVGCVLLTSERWTLAWMAELNALFLSWFEQACR